MIAFLISRGGALPSKPCTPIYTAQEAHCNTSTALYASYLSYNDIENGAEAFTKLPAQGDGAAKDPAPELQTKLLLYTSGQDGVYSFNLLNHCNMDGRKMLHYAD